MTTALLADRRIRAAELLVGRQHAGAAVGEGPNWGGPSPEQEIEQVGRVGDIGRVVAVRVRHGNAAGSRAAEEEPVERTHGVGDVDRAPDDKAIP